MDGEISWDGGTSKSLRKHRSCTEESKVEWKLDRSSAPPLQTPEPDAGAGAGCWGSGSRSQFQIED